ncbi:MAG: response regulator, partial [Gemmataceae bacterium]
MQVLVAEDDDIQQHWLQSLLPRWGYEPVLVSDGQAAWEVLRQDEQAPEMAILDWIMPGLTGPEVCQRVRQLTRDRYTYLL